MLCLLYPQRHRQGTTRRTAVGIARFRLTDTDPPRIDPGSEKVVLTWYAGGHNGCDMHFGPDGFLYISTGDGTGPNPPDDLDTGQDISDLLKSRSCASTWTAKKTASLTPFRPTIPSSRRRTPRPEIWAYGFRNPWRMSFDRPTGDLWVGDVGWEQWEMIYRVQKGGNYGWSIMEGPQQVHPEGKRGPDADPAARHRLCRTPKPPPSPAAMSIDGKTAQGAAGVYICGDWATLKIWATRFDGDKIVWHQELAQGKERVVAFGEDHDKDLYFVNHRRKGNDPPLRAERGGAKLIAATFPRNSVKPACSPPSRTMFPLRESCPFSVNVELWADHASRRAFRRLAGTAPSKCTTAHPPWPNYSGNVHFPKDGVLAKTIALEMEPRQSEEPAAGWRRKFSISMALPGRATAMPGTMSKRMPRSCPAGGMDRSLHGHRRKGAGPKREQHWHYPSRTECLICHNPWAGYTLAFNFHQLNKDHDYGGIVDNQLRTLQHIDLATFLTRNWSSDKEQTALMPRHSDLTNPFDSSASLDDRARSYLHVNCSHCHQFGAGGTADLNFHYQAPLDQCKTLEVRPSRGPLRSLAPRSLRRAIRSVPSCITAWPSSEAGGCRTWVRKSSMKRGLRLMHDWIRQLPIRKSDRALIEKLRSLDGKSHNDERSAIIRELLSSTSSALMLASRLGENQVRESVRAQVLERGDCASQQPGPRLVRAVPTRRPAGEATGERNPAGADPSGRKGIAERGRELFSQVGRPAVC